MKNNRPVKEGDILTFDVLEWYHEGYEFGHPCLILSPIINNNSDSNPESIIEDALISLVIGHIKLGDNRAEQEIAWREWNLSYLRKCFNAARKGKKFAKAGYKATRKKFEIIYDEEGVNGLSWKELNNK